MFKKLYSNKYFPLVLQIVSLVVFIVILSLGIGITTDNVKFAKILRNTNLGTLVVWSYWWPLIVVTAVFLGRHWCTICPIELITHSISFLSLKKRVPNWLKNGWGITALYACILLIGIETLSIHRVPNGMAFYLLTLVALAVIATIIFDKRSFCSYLCPVGNLLGLYSLFSKWGIRVKDSSKCSKCKEMTCVSKDNRNKFLERSCTSNIHPKNLDIQSRACIMCTQCIKSCSHNNVSLQKVDRVYNSTTSSRIKGAEVGMIVLLTGFISYEILSSWSLSNQMLHFLPNYFINEFGMIGKVAKLFNTLFVFVLMPVCFYAVLSSIIYFIEDKHHSIISILKRSALYILPMIAFGHVFKAMLKTTSRLPYWKYALDKPFGIINAQKILEGEVHLTHMSWISPLVIFLGVSGLLFAYRLSVKKILKDLDIMSHSRLVYIIILTIYLLFILSGPISSLF
ncbi:4Fe-4S binding protein [Halosquirtibacter xylanolyticus]|uniref:4Fe-4S binding protein n=1 Tax=Halosquirtibacter xylanolyticus TaxID=3374599 RepID=UPI003748263D|nr:4Fe-4S binding protein [Prolixibacteraceae bacterium]